MRESRIDRRRFIAAAVAVGGVTMDSLGPEALRLSLAYAQAPDESTLQGLARLARHIYPHASLPDSVYAEVLDAALGMAAGDPALQSAFDSAAAALDAGQNEAFAELDEAAQLEAIQAIDASADFAAIQGAVRLMLYNHPAVWELLGYEGPSFQFGGYLGRGSGEVDWLEEQG